MNIKQDIKDIARFEQIVQILFKHGFGYLLERLRLKDFLTLHERLQKDKFQEGDTKPYRLRLIMEELGGAFIKLGQLLSLRPDLIPKEYCREFKRLQDEVRPFPTEVAKRVIETELKKPLKDIFSSFEEKTIAAASIGQVYVAKLKTKEDVVVKVQRPDIEAKMKTDIDILYHLAELIESHYKQDLVDVKEIVKEFERYTNEELDYVNEGNNVERFYANFRNEKNTIIPKAYKGLTTKRVLVIDYIEGVKLNEIEKVKDIKKERLANKIVSAVFKQVFIDGFFHADPHPGNILVLDKKVAFIDFGIVGKIDDELKEKIFELFYGMINKDPGEMASALIDIGMTDYDINKDVLERDLKDSLGSYYGAALHEIDFVDVFHKITRLARKDKIRLPADFVLLGKAVITLESVAGNLNPKFNIVDAAKPFINRVIKKRTEPGEIIKRIKESSIKVKEFLENIPSKTNALLYRIRKTDATLRDIDDDIKSLTVEMDRSSNRVTYALIITALVISSALLIEYNRFVMFGIPAFSFIGIVAAIFIGIALVISIIKEKKR